jgi:hypothetical protein
MLNERLMTVTSTPPAHSGSVIHCGSTETGTQVHKKHVDTRGEYRNSDALLHVRVICDKIGCFARAFEAELMRPGTELMLSRFARAIVAFIEDESTLPRPAARVGLPFTPVEEPTVLSEEQQATIIARAA